MERWTRELEQWRMEWSDRPGDWSNGGWNGAMDQGIGAIEDGMER
ncbi:hypothetical protein [Alkalicoccobacillus plakortidis]|nr:hypothetical protein [Alkalicoccobacillus plakortidis]